VVLFFSSIVSMGFMVLVANISVSATSYFSICGKVIIDRGCCVEVVGWVIAGV
jgi:hypothetical protein